MNDTIMAIATVDLALSVLIFAICFCRVVVSSKQVVGRVRLKFILLGPSALAFGLSPAWGAWHSVESIFLMFAVAIGLMSESFQWRWGPPDSVKLDTMPSELRENL